ncbi:unnamed protein product, partial [Mesorhabditis belari]|uniref:Uncharacterized protein n=1 Tax=Mesorhabditis belari TaxID=2138241 RepID=A0AAF3J9A8_9BILA
MTDGSFAAVQCDSLFCWCVSDGGIEVRGTRIGRPLLPNCAVSRECPQKSCIDSPTECLHGAALDSNGCETCDCFDPCHKIACPGDSFCVPMAPSECLTPRCRHLPRCVINPCPIGAPLKDITTLLPVECRENNQCRDTMTPSYCRAHTSQGGYCCPAPEPRSAPGGCPTVGISTSCTRDCVLDDGCPSGNKCCFNGCGMSCLPAVIAIVPIHREPKIGSCLPVEIPEEFETGKRLESECVVNEECPQLQLCCNVGFGRKACTSSHLTTPCLHARGAAQSLAVFNPNYHVPTCDSEGAFELIQSVHNLRWCVDEMGNEIPGTRTMGRVPRCRLPRSCRIMPCDKKCPVGLRLDVDGCPLCECLDPCQEVVCRKGHHCSLVSVQCTTERCPPVPRCIPSICPSNSPPLMISSLLIECSPSTRCPQGFHCVSTGFEGRGYCCQGAEPIHMEKWPACPSLPLLNSTTADGPSCDVECYSHNNCPGSLCCFNGCGIQCIYKWSSPKQELLPSVGEKEKEVKNPITIMHKIIPAGKKLIKIVSSEEEERVGKCPSIKHLPGREKSCINLCSVDDDCPSFEKCCSNDCGRECLPAVLPGCVLLLSGYLRALHQLSSPYPPPVQCTKDGRWKEAQCDIRAGECWCVNPLSGIEIVGTRKSSNQPLPDCSVARGCRSLCAASTCPRGLLLDSSGCPLIDCQCASPCDRLDCSSRGQTCIVTSDSCLEGNCPLVPKCVSSGCPNGWSPIVRLRSPLLCGYRESECPTGECHPIPDSQDNLSMCCLKIAVHKIETTTVEVQMIESAPNETNCQLLRASYEEIRQAGGQVLTAEPICQKDDGKFSAVQCELSGLCRCVDRSTGTEILGSKRIPLIGQDVCTAQIAHCSVRCVISCPFGVETDGMGCPLAGCPCRDPCLSIRCPYSSICLLRSPDCSEAHCIAMPVCEPNPCSRGNKPAFDSRTFSPFECKNDRSVSCPADFYCAGENGDGRGVCCPGVNGVLSECPHGIPYPSFDDGSPLQCSVQMNGCPSTHYCLTHPRNSSGICCVTKRHVCHERMDIGGCSLNVQRYFYSPDEQSCLPFEYGGCGGNLNNFPTRDSCERFCEGIGFNMDTPLLSDDGRPSEQYEMGFALKGSRLELNDKDRIKSQVLAILLSRFGLTEREVRDLSVRVPDSVRFVIQSPDARQKAQQIHEAVMNGSLLIRYLGSTYSAEPHTWFATQVAEKEKINKSSVYWAVLIAATTLCLVVFAVLCCACSWMIRAKENRCDSARSASSDLRSHSFSHHIPPQMLHASRASTIRMNSDRSNDQRPQLTRTLY